MEAASNDSQKQKQNVTTKEYAEELRQWMAACACWQATVFHYSYAAYQGAVQHALLRTTTANLGWRTATSQSTDVPNTNLEAARRAAAFEPQPNAPNNANNVRAGFAGNQQQPVVTRYRVPPIWKRICAEAIDFIILMTLRVCLVVIGIKLFSLDEKLSKVFADWSLGEWTVARMGARDQYVAAAGRAARQANIDALWPRFNEPDEEAAAGEEDEDAENGDDLEDLLLFSPLYLLLELTNTCIVTAYETFFTMRERRRGAGGCTPGKLLLGLRIVRATDMLELPDAPDRGLLGSPGLLVEVHGDSSNLGFTTALCRAAMKNFSQTFLFPLSFTAMFARNRRAFYDVFTNVIVVEKM